MNLGGPEILLIAVVVLLLFGGTQLPKLARSLGEAQKEFKKGLREGTSDSSDQGKDQTA
jgi:sec-independent protein translocase protein TatA